MTIHAIAYASKAVPGLTQAKVESLTSDAYRFNQIAGVTGVLLYDGAWFFQYLEGPRDGLYSAYDRICGAASHVSITELATGTVETRLFPYWSIRQLSIDSVRLGRLMLAEWKGFAHKGVQVEGAGVDQLSEIVRPYVQAA